MTDYIDPTVPSTETNGSPTESDRNSLSAGADGPLMLHDVRLVETLASFNRERVPERNPHAKGAGAFGTFTTTHDVSQYTRAAVFQQGAESETLLRFSTVAGEQGSPDTWRDVRGFSLRFYTSEGNLDIVGNNTPVFFLRDPMTPQPHEPDINALVRACDVHDVPCATNLSSARLVLAQLLLKI